jgi:metal-sulfur cluster biosynthetic enzyme
MLSHDLEAEVWARLQTVTDPELDEPVTELEFVTRAEVDADHRVHIAFRLPTYWCAANFSFLMADDMRAAVATLPWVRGVSVTLGEHMYADTINAGLAQGLSFQQTFGAEADGDLDALRQTFLVKAFQRRQAALLAHLLAVGYAAEMLVDLAPGELNALDLDDAGARLLARYLERRPVIAAVRTARAFFDAEGEALQAETLANYVRLLRRVDVNAEFNSALCRGLLHARFDMETPLPPRRAASVRQPACRVAQSMGNDDAQNDVA